MKEVKRQIEILKRYEELLEDENCFSINLNENEIICFFRPSSKITKKIYEFGFKTFSVKETGQLISRLEIEDNIFMEIVICPHYRI